MGDGLSIQRMRDAPTVTASREDQDMQKIEQAALRATAGGRIDTGHGPLDVFLRVWPGSTR
ncbi:hypothetical protein AAH991_38070 [Microbispora sp. ZYX-F-249]|uniref:DUF305 domain-containing protein n=1 Tax=Microbispora maris TaxID=3144104 RepID=A0ABV0B0E5_9ACTN